MADHELSKEDLRAKPVTFSVDGLKSSLKSIRPDLLDDSDRHPEARQVVATVLPEISKQTTVGGMVDVIHAQFGTPQLVEGAKPGHLFTDFVGGKHDRLLTHRAEMQRNDMLSLRADIVQACSNSLLSVKAEHGNPLGKAFKALCDERSTGLAR